MENFIVIAVFQYTHEIEILKHRLDQEGVTYFFENEATASVAPFYSLALGGIKLKIHPNDSDIVNNILEELKGGHSLRIV